MNLNHALAVLFLTANAGLAGANEQVTRYSEQSGQIYGGGSCCGPYTYANSSASTLGLWGCHNAGVYGCIQTRNGLAWRWDAEGLIPDGSIVVSAQLVFRHPHYCSPVYSYALIGATDGLLDSSSLASMEVAQEEILSYSGMEFSIDLDPSVVEQAIVEGSLAAKLYNSDLNGCNFTNYGALAPRLVVTYDVSSTPCPGDLNSDRIVDAMDISMILGHWGQADPDYDIDGSGSVDGYDLAIVLAAWGECQE